MVDSHEKPYGGDELDLFALAGNWKGYIKAQLSPYLKGDVLEVGAGIGATTSALHDGSARRWVCLEPDVELARRLSVRLRSAENRKTNVIIGSLRALAGAPCFDCVLYIDVLEHIDDDLLQVHTAAQLVRPDGHIVILAPAHQWLFSDFDKRVGHLRRYNRSGLKSLMPFGWLEEKLSYIDSVGVLLSLANAICLRQSMPTRSQIRFWDSVCVPISCRLDRRFGGMLGKSLLAVWRKVA